MVSNANDRTSRVSRWTLRTSLLLVCVSGCFAGQARTSISCHSIVVTGELSSGQHFEKTIGGGLAFRLDPERLGPKGELDGWRMTLVPLQGHDDYIYPVNPPLRFNGEQILGPSYGDDTKTSLGHPHEMRFLLSSEDYDRIAPLLTNALWPYSAPRPDQAADEYLSALGRLTKGQLKMTVQAYGADPASGSIRHIKFQVDFIAPATFRFDRLLKPQPVGCPSLSD